MRKIIHTVSSHDGRFMERYCCDTCGGISLFEEDYSPSKWHQMAELDHHLFCSSLCERKFNKFNSDQELHEGAYAIIQVLDTPEQLEE